MQFDLIELQESMVKTLRKTYRGIQTAIISRPVEGAPELLAAERVKIDYVMCWLIEQVALKCCCLGFDHIAKASRSKQCKTCGAEGHMSKN